MFDCHCSPLQFFPAHPSLSLLSMTAQRPQHALPARFCLRILPSALPSTPPRPPLQSLLSLCVTFMPPRSPVLFPHCACPTVHSHRACFLARTVNRSVNPLLATSWRHRDWQGENADLQISGGACQQAGKLERKTGAQQAGGSAKASLACTGMYRSRAAGARSH